MISLRKLIAMTKKWQKLAGVSGKRTISMPPSPNKHHVAHKGHFVVYTTDKARFVVPLAYLSSKLFRELFRMSEEEFGLPSDGPITLPCDAVFMEYVVSVAQRHVSEELEMALLVSLMASSTHHYYCGSVDNTKTCASRGLHRMIIY